MARYRKNTKRIDPRYFLHETVNRGEKEPGVGGQPPEWERKLAKSDPSGPTARSKRRHVRGLEDPDVDVEKLEEAEEILQEEPPPGMVTTADMAPVAAPEESESRVTRVLDWLINAFERATQDLTDAEIASVTQELGRQIAPGGEIDIGPGGALEESAEG